MPTVIRQANVISHCGNFYCADNVDDEELGFWHYSYLISIAKRPGICAEELAKRIFVNKSNVARNLAYLEEHGYVRREQSKCDKRMLLCYPTEKLNAVLPSILKASADWSDYITEDLTPEERKTFEELLSRVSAKARLYYERREKQ